MSEMVERVAKAILQAIGEQSGCHSDRCCCSGAADVLDCKLGVTEDQLALAAIEAMREPPKGFDKIVYHGDYGDDVWRESINAALKD